MESDCILHRSSYAERSCSTRVTWWHNSEFIPPFMMAQNHLYIPFTQNANKITTSQKFIICLSAIYKLFWLPCSNKPIFYIMKGERKTNVGLLYVMICTPSIVFRIRPKTKLSDSTEFFDISWVSVIAIIIFKMSKLTPVNIFFNTDLISVMIM